MKKVNIDKNKLYSIAEVAAILGVSRTAVFNRVKKKIIKGQKVGRNFIIQGKDLHEYLYPTDELTDSKKVLIEQIVKRAVREYGDALKKLGKT